MNDAKQTLLAASTGDIFECVTNTCGVSRTERILVLKVTKYRGEKRLKVCDADKMLVGTMTVIPGRIGLPIEPCTREWLSASLVASN